MKTLDLPLEVKELSDEGTFTGYGSTFGGIDRQLDKIAPGAFAKTLARHQKAGTAVPILWQHDPGEPIGVWDELAEDSRGLKGTGRLVLETARGREAHALLKAGALRGLSIGFETIKSEPEGAIRVLKEIDLWEISLVTFPADPRAGVRTVKANRIEEWARALRDGTPPPIKEFEDILREAGVPKSMATAIASHGYAKAVRSESEGKASEPAVSALLAAAAAFRTRT